MPGPGRLGSGRLLGALTAEDNGCVAVVVTILGSIRSQAAAFVFASAPTQLEPAFNVVASKSQERLQ